MCAQRLIFGGSPEHEGHGELVSFFSAHREQDEQPGVQKRSEDSELHKPDQNSHPINHVRNLISSWMMIFLPV